MSTAESASVKMPPGPSCRRRAGSLAAMASTWVGSSPTMSRASASTAALSAGVSAPPKNVRPMPTSALVGAQLERDELARVGGGGQADDERVVGRRAQDAGGDVGDLHWALLMGYRPSTLPQTDVLVTINQEGTLMRMVLGAIATLVASLLVVPAWSQDAAVVADVLKALRGAGTSSSSVTGRRLLIRRTPIR